MTRAPVSIHPSAEVSTEAHSGESTRIWKQVHVREYAHIRENCTIGKGVYIDAHVIIGSNVKIQNHVSIFEGVTLEDGVFIGPHAFFTNHLYPRAITPDGHLKSADDWTITPTLVKHGASIGAGTIIVCGVTIGSSALIGAGSVVTRDVPPHRLVYGNPTHQHGYVCRCALHLTNVHEKEEKLVGPCQICGDMRFLQ